MLDGDSAARYALVMVTKTSTDRVGALIARVRTGKALPEPAERKRIREQAGVSLRQAGAAVGVSFMAIVRWEAGAQPREPQHLLAYGRLLDELRLLNDGRTGA